MEYDNLLKSRPFRVDTLCALLTLLFPDLGEGLAGDEQEQASAVKCGMARLRYWTRKCLAKRFPDIARLADEVCQAFLVEIIHSNAVVKYTPKIAKPSTYFGKILFRVSLRFARKERRNIFAQIDTSRVETRDTPPMIDVMIDREALDHAIDRYDKLVPNQQAAVRKIYPFFNEPKVSVVRPSPLEHVDRHRGLKAICKSVRDKYRS